MGPSTNNFRHAQRYFCRLGESRRERVPLIFFSLERKLESRFYVKRKYLPVLTPNKNRPFRAILRNISHHSSKIFENWQNLNKKQEGNSLTIGYFLPILRPMYDTSCLNYVHAPNYRNCETAIHLKCYLLSKRTLFYVQHGSYICPW